MRGGHHLYKRLGVRRNARTVRLKRLMKNKKKEKKVPKRVRSIEFCLAKHAKNIWIVTNTPIKKQRRRRRNQRGERKNNVNVNINYNL